MYLLATRAHQDYFELPEIPIGVLSHKGHRVTALTVLFAKPVRRLPFCSKMGKLTFLLAKLRSTCPKTKYRREMRKIFLLLEVKITNENSELKRWRSQLFKDHLAAHKANRKMPSGIKTQAKRKGYELQRVLINTSFINIETLIDSSIFAPSVSRSTEMLLEDPSKTSNRYPL